MKKTLMIALAGMMLFAFTQCGGGGSKQYQDTKKAYEELTKLANSMKSCEEMNSTETQEKAEKILTDMFEKAKSYKDEDKATEEELKKIKQMEEDFAKLGEEIEKKLCK